MKNTFLSLMLLFCLQTVTAQQYEHKAIAIIPFRVITMPVTPGQYTAFEQLRIYEREKALLLQQLMYNSLSTDSASLAVSIQDYRLTDSLLQLARIDPRDAYWKDKAALCKWLKVDAVVTGMLQHPKVSSRAKLEADVISGNRQRLTADRNPERKLILKIFDGISGNEIWQLTEIVLAHRITDASGLQLEKGLYRKIRKQFPYVL
jgi:hypothetical protein